MTRNTSNWLTEAVRRHPNCAAILFSACVITLLLAMIEVGARIQFHLAPPASALEARYTPSMQPSDLGMEFPPDTQVAQDKSRDGRTLMHSVCTIDQHGLRHTPVTDPDERVGIYLFIDDHVYRAAGSLRMYNLWCSPYPCYQLADGRLEYRGSFEEARPVRNLIYRFLWKSHAVRNWQLEWPPLAKGTLELTAALIRESKETFERTFPGSTFYVLMYPGFAPQVGPRILDLLARDHVQSLTFPDLFSDSEWANRLPDGHPSAAMQEKLALALVARLGLK